ncbi:transglycosylase SLT domain-containing protein [Desulfobulbus rhabdoformis]|uniref:transglycosylase SLT domain-containing protein n=1 Tax=Desulfobulbus rhabdoformis TaxID=34032 RepID=UPI00196489FE|nr:transglycosylase SLT domain-containing protein [Desulfobulbus rhabdoformis]MBM9614555.1 transglycosylase SLT domain-containing protein [Desulfobulbus rhabdoformis]
MARSVPEKEPLSSSPKNTLPAENNEAEHVPAKTKASRPKKAPVKSKKKSPPKKRAAKKRNRKQPKKPPVSKRLLAALVSLELLGLLFSLGMVVVVVLGYATDQFSGIGFFSHLLPFALGVVGLVLIAALLLVGWYRLRSWIRPHFIFLPAALAILLAVTAGGLCLRGDFFFAFSQFRMLVGGREEAARVSLTHQVFAAYRRFDATQEQKIIDRARDYTHPIDDAAVAYSLDPDLLRGLAATESSFLPRDSKDGGKGLFQITRVPEHILVGTANLLQLKKIDVNDHRQNAFLAAATLHYYLQQMNNDLFLGLLAYNIGPKNGGLRFIMQQYGATDFITIQPYLQQLPRAYPIRVLSHALAFRLYQKMQTLPPYEEGLNAVRIQHIGIPGM